MNWDKIEGQWKKFKGEIRQKWGTVMDDEFAVIGGTRDKFAGQLQHRYGTAKENAREEIAELERRLGRDRPEDAPRVSG